MEKINHKGILIAIRVKKLKDGTVPLTLPSEPLQVVTQKRSVGQITSAHFHSPKTRTTQFLQECLIVLKGKIRVDLYGNDKKKFKSVYLTTNQLIVFLAGGHAVYTLRKTDLIELKNGPFLDDKVKL